MAGGDAIPGQPSGLGSIDAIERPVSATSPYDRKWPRASPAISRCRVLNLDGGSRTRFGRLVLARNPISCQAHSGRGRSPADAQNQIIAYAVKDTCLEGGRL